MSKPPTTDGTPGGRGTPAPPGRLRRHLAEHSWSWFAIAALLVTVTLLHYETSHDQPIQHQILRRLYYLPIVWAAFLGGLWGGLTVAALATLAYLPHAFFLTHHLDPAAVGEKASELVLYFLVAGLVGVLVTRERRARELAAAAMLERAAAEANAARLDGLVHLTRGLAHEIRNPLASIQGSVEIVADALPGDHPRRAMAEIALKETTRLNRVLTDFLEFARPRPAELAPVDAAGVVRHVVRLLEGEARRRGVELVGETEPGRLMVLADEDHLIQILVNLARNALDVEPAGGRVSVAASTVKKTKRARSDKRVEFAVRDHGPGVPEELGASIYDPYVTHKEGGTGLGLPISALLVRQQGGLLSHRPAAAGGTVFRFDLACAQG